MATVTKVHQTGKRVDYTPAAAVAAGTIVVVGGKVKGVATSDIAANEPGSLLAEYGTIYKCKHTPAAAIADNAQIYVTPAGELATTSSGNAPFGLSFGAWPTTATEILVRATFLFLLMCGVSMGQQNCPGGQCQPRVISQQIVAQRVIAPQARETINLSPITAADAKALADAAKERPAIVGDRLSVVQNATVRVTVSNVCGSGCVVGFDSDGRALILTNAHVAGTQRGRVVNVQRWDDTGRTETAKASIVASGYGRGNSIDFALLRAADGFANGIVPIPIADRYPDPESMITTFGAPRCEWPSLQVLRMTRNDGQVIKWKPEAIGGRSGSAVIDYADGAPRVVGLLTWGGGGEGLGQSTPFLLSVMRGKMPASLEPLPQGIKEVKELAAPQESLDLDSIIAKPIIKKPTPQTEPDVAPTPQTPPTAPAPVTVIQIPQLPFLPPWATAIITMINSGILAWHYWQNRKNKPEAK